MEHSNQSFAAFFSYVQRNDEHDRGKLTDLRKLLEAELWAQTGKDLKVFQDKENLGWGDVWKERITKALGASTFLIAIITPSYLESRSCRFEFEYFLKRESLSKRKDLILPILYIDTTELKTSRDSVAIEISKRQWIDWRELRFTSLESAKLNKKIEILAKRIRDKLLDQATTYIESIKFVSFPNSVTTEKSWEEVWQPKNSTQVNIPLTRNMPELFDQDEKTFHITVLLSSTGNIEWDRRRIKTAFGTLISFHGTDRFSFQISEDDKSNAISFPNDTTRVCPELLARLEKLMGQKCWRIEEIVSQ